MPAPLALCLEDRSAPTGAPRYLRCVALVGRQPGLRLDAAGAVQWQQDEPPRCEVWVSADDRLIVYRPEGAKAVALHRSGRSLELPVGKPVVALDQDELTIGERRLRLHVHGVAKAVAAPSPLPVRQNSSVTRMAAVVAVGAAAVAGCERPMEIRESPPAPPYDPTATAPPATSGTSTTSSSSPQTIATEPEPTGPPAATGTLTPHSPEPIEVREDPPDMEVMD